MKKLLISVMLVLPAIASAADLKPYVEGQIGYMSVDSINSKAMSGEEDGLIFTNAKIKLDYDNEFSYGAEVGLKDVLPNVRLGASITTVKLDFDSAKLSGTISDGSTTLSGSARVTSADLASVGADLDTRVKLYMLNAYYDFKNSTSFTPFVGVGVGTADIKGANDNEMALSASLGARYAINEHVYLGAKASYININGPDVEGIKCKDVDLYTANIMLGYEF